MATRTLTFGLDRLMSEGTLVGLDDSELLDRFYLRNDQRAFAILVQRHGPLVWSLCNSILHSPHDADDAFQATFLILARRAGEIARPERLSCWLHGVALKVAKKARSRRKTSTTLTDQAARYPEVESDLNRREAIAILHTELERIPAKYRNPIILCHLEGLTHEAAAAQLGWPVGTVRGRLARGRDNLRERLMRRGLSMSMLVNPINPQGMLTSRAYQALTILDASMKTMEASRTALQLTQGVLMMMSFTKVLNLGMATTLGAGLIIFAAGWTQAPGQGKGDGDSPAVVTGGKLRKDQPIKSVTIDKKAIEQRKQEREALRKAREDEIPKLAQELAWLTRVFSKSQLEIELEELEINQLKKRYESLIAMEARGFPGDGNPRFGPFTKDKEHEDRFAESKLQQSKLIAETKDSILNKSAQLSEMKNKLEELKETLAELPSPTLLKAGKPHRVQIGDQLLVEVLEALPGRPITGERIVRSDGTISLGFYGDLRVVGMTRDEIKVAVIDQVSRWLNEKVLGLIKFDVNGEPYEVAPIDSDRVFVDESEVDYKRKKSELERRVAPEKPKATNAEKP